MFRHVSKLKNLLISSTKLNYRSIPTISPIKFVLQTTFHTISTNPDSKLLNFKFPFNYNHQIKNGSANIQSIKYFSKIPNRKRKRKNARIRRNDNDKNFKYDARIPKLVYLHNPLKYLKTKLKIWKLKLRWDRKFNQKEFIRGTTQAAVVLTNVIRTQNFENLGKFTTRVGYHQITRDMILSKGDPRLQMIQFRNTDLRRAIPVKIMLYEQHGFRHCLIDMFFVGMRNVNDFKSRAAHENMSELIKKYEIMHKNTPGAAINPQNNNNNINENNKFNRIIFAEIFIRFYRDYTDKKVLDNWNVSFYKVLNFDILHIKNPKKK